MIFKSSAFKNKEQRVSQCSPAALSLLFSVYKKNHKHRHKVHPMFDGNRARARELGILRFGELFARSEHSVGCDEAEGSRGPEGGCSAEGKADDSS